MIRLALRRFRTGLELAGLLPAFMLLGILKHVVPLKRLARLVWRSAAAGQRNQEAERRLAGNVLRLSQLARLSDRDCLQRSLLLYRVLSRAGADPKLVVGFHRQNGKMMGHAWVVVDDDAVIESEADLRRFAPVLRFGARGDLVSKIDGRTDVKAKPFAAKN